MGLIYIFYTLYHVNIYITSCLSSNNILLLYICNILRRETYIYIHKSIYCRFGHVLLTYCFCIVIVNLGVFVKKTCRYIYISIKICRNWYRSFTCIPFPRRSCTFLEPLGEFNPNAETQPGPLAREVHATVRKRQRCFSGCQLQHHIIANIYQ